MNKVLEWIKAKWKIVLIILLALLFVSKCTSANNYKRKLHKAEDRIEYVTDSLTSVYTNSAKYIDSLNLVIKDKNRDIKERDAEIISLNKQLKIYSVQNSKLNNTNKDLANRKIEIITPTPENKTNNE